MFKEFEIIYAGHERPARELILSDGLRSEKELAVMSVREVEKAINEKYVALRSGGDWLLISRDAMDDFNDLVTPISR